MQSVFTDLIRCVGSIVNALPSVARRGDAPRRLLQGPKRGTFLRTPAPALSRHRSKVTACLRKYHASSSLQLALHLQGRLSGSVHASIGRPCATAGACAAVCSPPESLRVTQFAIMQQQAIVTGSGMCGLATAQVLSSCFDRVNILDRDTPDDLLQQSAVDAVLLGSKVRTGVQQVCTCQHVVAKVWPPITGDSWPHQNHGLYMLHQNIRADACMMVQTLNPHGMGCMHGKHSPPGLKTLKGAQRWWCGQSKF